MVHSPSPETSPSIRIFEVTAMSLVVGTAMPLYRRMSISLVLLYRVLSMDVSRRLTQFREHVRRCARIDLHAACDFAQPRLPAQSSSASRFTAGAFGFFDLTQWRE